MATSLDHRGWTAAPVIVAIDGHSNNGKTSLAAPMRRTAKLGNCRADPNSGRQRLL
jgi:hypothetical protein